jgi:hypothetical protein
MCALPLIDVAVRDKATSWLWALSSSLIFALPQIMRILYPMKDWKLFSLNLFLHVLVLGSMWGLEYSPLPVETSILVSISMVLVSFADLT